MASSTLVSESPPPAPAAAERTRGSVGHVLAFEAAERFAFYGMLTAVFLLLTRDADITATETIAQRHLAWIGVAVFGLAFVGAIAAESLLGRFRMVITGAIVACVGYAALALGPAQGPLLFAGLGLVALGTGALKPCVAAHLGDQFTATPEQLLSRTFAWFYFAIHAGALLASVVTQQLIAAQQNGLRIAMFLPLIALAVGTLILWSGRAKQLRQPAFGSTFAQELFSRETAAALPRLLGIFLLVALFWIAWQRGAADMWPQQAAAMHLLLFNVELEPAQIATANALFILLFVPLLHYAVLPAVGRFVNVTALRRIGAGLFFGACSFVVAALVERAIAGGGQPSVAWQLLAWALLTLGEVLVIVTTLELSYRWAPQRIKSIVIALWLLTFAAREIPLPVGDAGAFATGANGYFFFAAVLGGAAVLLAIVSLLSRSRPAVATAAVPQPPASEPAEPPHDST
jgi:proton-dependent oligopeptide transporter, POT family